MKRLAAAVAAVVLLGGCGQDSGGEVQSIARSAEDFCGSWQCGNYFLTIDSFAPGIYSAVLIRADGLNAAEMWEYPSMKFDGGRLLANDGTRYDTDTSKTPPVSGYDLNQQAEFLLTDEGILWNDLSLNKGAGLCFAEGQSEPPNV